MVRLGGLVGQARGSTGMLLICKKLGGRRVRREEGREGGKQREKENIYIYIHSYALPE